MPREPRRSRPVYYPAAIEKTMDQRVLDLGYSSFSDYAWTLIEQDLQKAQKQGTVKEERPATPREELDKVVSETARIGQLLGVKLDIFRSIFDGPLTKKGAKKPTSKAQVKAVSTALWNYIIEKNGLITFERKTYGIEKKDVDLYEKFGMLKFRTKELLELIERESQQTQSGEATKEEATSQEAATVIAQA